MPCGHAVRLQGAGPDWYAAQTVDLSRGGILVAVTDVGFRTREDQDGVSLVEERFPRGLEVAFVDTGVVRAAKVVRATLQRGAHLALGCEFAEPLTKADALALGIVAGESGVPEALAPVLSFVPRAGVPLSLVMLGASENVVGPFALGRVLAVGERTIEAAFAKPPEDVVASCRVEPFNALLVIGRERLWSGRGTLVACRPAADGSTIRVLAEGALGRAVRRRVVAAASQAGA